ncbi:N-acetylneuraminate 9-O-acetyltransferase [Apodemus speciosus]|uniref:N-acetylneuraminate 9-O-acetyltransferase n=1 Tax=Apodemus speciosus TaxID=105296 RepID=A0ABQ0EU10_APOSI
MAALAYNLGKREINHYFSVRSAKVLALVAVLLLAACHLASRRYRGEAKTCLDSLSKPHVIVAGAATWSIKIHNGSEEALSQYKMNITALAPLLEKLAKTSDVYWVLQDPVYEDLLSENRKMITNEKIDAYNEAAVSILNSSARTSKSNVKLFSVSKLIAQETIMESLDGLHLPESSRETSAMILMNVYCNKILKPVDGSCCQPRPPLTLIQKLAACFFTLSIIGYFIFYVIHRNAHRKNKPCTDLESGEEKKNIINTPVSSLEILLQSFCKLGLIMAYFYMCDRANLFMKENKFYTHSSFFIPIIYILVLGVFYNENTKETGNIFLPVYMHIRVLVAAYLFQTGYGHFSYFWIKGDFGIHRVCQVLFRLNFLVVVLCIVMDRPYQFYYFVPLVTVWFMVIYVTLALWPQITQKKGAFEKIFSLWPLSKCFELEGSVYEWWFRWRLDRYVVFHGVLFAFIYLALQRRQILSEGKGEPLFSNKISNFLLFVSVVSFLTYSIWASSCKNKAECNELHPSVSVVQITEPLRSPSKGSYNCLKMMHLRVWNLEHVNSRTRVMTQSGQGLLYKDPQHEAQQHVPRIPALGQQGPEKPWGSLASLRSHTVIVAFILIRNIPGYARSIYSSFFAWFGRISLELFICQYHIWLAADTRGILVLVPGNPTLNIIVSTFIFVCVAHEISQITSDLAQVAIPKDSPSLFRRLACTLAFFGGLLIVSSIQDKSRL